LCMNIWTIFPRGNSGCDLPQCGLRKWRCEGKKLRVSSGCQNKLSMTGKDIITKVKTLGLPEGSYIVFGAGPLAVAGIRETSDIDMYVKSEIIYRMKKLGWKKLDKGGRDTPIVYECFELHDNWNFGTSYDPPFTDLLATADYYDGVPFVSLTEVRKWKLASARPKDLVDIKLIDKYLQGY